MGGVFFLRTELKTTRGLYRSRFENWSTEQSLEVRWFAAHLDLPVAML